MATNAERTTTAPNPRRAPPVAVSVSAQHETMFSPDGTSYDGLRVSGIVPTVPDVVYEVWAKPTAGGHESWQHIGTGRTLPIYVRDPKVLATTASVTIALVIASALGVNVGPEGSTQATLTFGTGSLPEDVTGFTAVIEGGQVLFKWTRIDADINPDVLGYEIRAGTTGWSSATLVGFVCPVLRDWFSVPRSKATGTAFYIKARTRLGAYSSAVGSATLSAAGATCIDNDSMVGYQEVTIVGGASTVTVTTKCPYPGGAPYITVTGSTSTGRQLSFNTSGYSVNGDLTYSFTLRASARAPAAGSWTVHVHEAGA